MTVTIFRDDFSGSSVDPAKWTVIERLGDQVNSELNGNTAANVDVTGGSLLITARFEDIVSGDTTTGAPNPRTVHYSSGHIQQATTPFLYGTIDVRAKPPGGIGVWPCIWMLGDGWQASQPFTANDPTGSANWPDPPYWEIDIAEFMNGHRTLVNCAEHFDSPNRGGSGEKTLPFDATTRFMVYRLVWTATTLEWFVDAEDGVGFRSLLSIIGTPGTDIPNTPGYLVINMAVGGIGGGTPDSSTFPLTMEVDYAQVTQEGTVSLAVPSIYVSPNSPTPVNPDKPTGTAAGDTLVSGRQSANPVDTLAGFTAVGSGTDNINCFTKFRLCDGSEGSTFAAGDMWTSDGGGAILRITGAHATTPIAGHSDHAGSGTATALVVNAITPSADDCMVVAFLHLWDSAGLTVTAPDGTWTKQADWFVDNGPGQAWTKQLTGGSGVAQGPWTFTASATQAHYVIQGVAVAPAPGGGPTGTAPPIQPPRNRRALMRR